ncbi:MAG: hypothetical protein M1350_07005 [Actinobacteria bacterium]|jgi:hypothetical protein|nr:hypothetical protein [Actinomycetota bacterium]
MTRSTVTSSQILRILACLALLASLSLLSSGCASATAETVPPVPSQVFVISSRFSHLYHPGSKALYWIASGTSLGPHGMQPAYASTVLECKATWRQLLSWYRKTLLTDGWQWIPTGRKVNGAQVLADHYIRQRREMFEVAVDNPNLLAKYGYPVHVRSGLVYEVSFVVNPQHGVTIQQGHHL